MLHVGWQRREWLECKRQSDGDTAHYPAHIKHLHARHHDGQRRDDQHHPGILVLHAYADLRFRQCDRDDCYEDNVYLRFLDAAHVSGVPDPEQHQRFLYPDLLYLQRKYAGRHKHDYSHFVGPGFCKANNHGYHGNTC